jgi:acyl-CoA synthetase (AMP-forming)/AMP-acid ligase II
VLDVRSALRRSAGFHRDRVAIISDGTELTYAGAWQRGIRFANAMRSLGARPGDRVAVLEDNCLASADFFLGTAIANLVRVPLYKRNSRQAHAHMLRETGCRILVAAHDAHAEVDGFADELPSLEHLIVRDDGYEDWLSRFPDDDPDPEVHPDDFHVIRHSAGTTGLPKGIAFSHRAWMNIERNWTSLLPPIELGDHSIHVGPISHGSGYLFLPTWLAGGCNVLEPRFNGPRLLELLSHYGGYTFGVPTMISDLLSGATAAPDLRKLKAFVVSGAPIHGPTALAARELLGPKLYQLYGQTECTPAAFMSPAEWFHDVAGSDPLRSCGRVMPYAELEIRDESNRPVPPGESGEIALRSDGQMVCIWGEPEMTAERLVDGWVLTGDIGTVDANGYLYLEDRKDDLIISGGFNIWPAELETAIIGMAGVREVAVFGVPHGTWGETPMAMVVREPGAAVLEADVVDRCVVALGSYKKPTVVEVMDTPLPRTPLGKVSRKALRARFWVDHGEVDASSVATGSITVNTSVDGNGALC